MFSNIKEVYIALHVVDFRKSWLGLQGEAVKLGIELDNNECLVFINRSRSQVRAIWKDKGRTFILMEKIEDPFLRPKIDRILDPSIQTLNIELLKDIFLSFNSVNI